MRYWNFLLLALFAISCSSGPDYDDYCYVAECIGIKLRAPENLSYSYLSSDSIRLEWEDFSSKEDGYILVRKGVSDTFMFTDTLRGDSVSQATFSNNRLFYSEIKVSAFSDTLGFEGVSSEIIINLSPSSFRIVSNSEHGVNDSGTKIEFSWDDYYNLASEYLLTEKYLFNDPIEYSFHPENESFTRSVSLAGSYIYTFRAINSNDTSMVQTDTTIVSGWKNENRVGITEIYASSTILGDNAVLISGQKENTGIGFQLFKEDEGWSAFTANTAFSGLENMLSYDSDYVLIRNSIPALRLFNVNNHSLKTISATHQLIQPNIALLDDGRVIISGIDHETDNPVIEIFDPGTETLKIIDNPFDEHSSLVSQELNGTRHLFLESNNGESVTAHYFDPLVERFKEKITFDYDEFEILGSELMPNGKVMFFSEDGRGGVPLFDPVINELSYTSPTNGTYIFALSTLNENIISLTGNDRYIEFIEMYSEEKDKWIIIDETPSQSGIDFTTYPDIKGFSFEKLREGKFLLTVQDGKSLEWKLELK